MPDSAVLRGQALSEWAENMKENWQRFCDVCNEEIPKGAKYQRSQMPAYAAKLLRVRDDPDLIPTWTTNTDGTIFMDICIVPRQDKLDRMRRLRKRVTVLHR